MIGISIFEIIIPSIINLKTVLIILSTVLVSSIIINLIRQFITRSSGGELYKIGLLNMIILIIHNLPEGIATFITSYQNIDIGMSLAFAISLHNIPEGYTQNISHPHLRHYHKLNIYNFLHAKNSFTN